MITIKRIDGTPIMEVQERDDSKYTRVLMGEHSVRIRESIKSQETQVSRTRPISHYLIGVALVLLAILFIYKRLTTLL